MAPESDWTDGVVNYCWAGSGRELLVQTRESILTANLINGILEQRHLLSVPSRHVIGFGYTTNGWWIAAREQKGSVLLHTAAGDSRLIQGLEQEPVSKASLSPDGGVLACIFKNCSVAIWSALEGNRLGGLRLALEGDDWDFLGEPRIANINWSTDSQFLAIQADPPLDQLLLVDGRTCQFVATVS